MKPDQLRAMTATQCGDAAVILLQFSGHLQRSANREQARVRWAEESIRKIIAPKLRQTTGASYEERKMLAVRNDDAATKVDAIRVNAQLRIDRLAFMSSKITDLARALMALQNTKRGRHD